MSEDKFTPGPWSAPDKGKLRGAVVAKDGEMVCDPSGAGGMRMRQRRTRDLLLQHLKCTISLTLSTPTML